MSVIEVFRNYLEEHHQQLARKDWKVEVRVLSVEEIVNEDVRARISEKYRQDLTCWVFFYDGGASDVVYLFQDKLCLQIIEIGLLKEGELVKPISFV